MNRRIKILLTLSIACNVLLAGIILGDASHGMLSRVFLPSTEALLARLPQDKRALFEKSMLPIHQDMDATRHQIEDAKKEALRILTANPFAKEAYMAQIRHISDLYSQMKRHMAEAVADIASQYTSEERAVLADILSQPPFAPPPREEKKKP